MVVARTEIGSYYLLGTQLQFYKMKRVMEMDGRTVVYQECILYHSTVASNMVKMILFYVYFTIVIKIWKKKKC